MQVVLIALLMSADLQNLLIGYINSLPMFRVGSQVDHCEATTPSQLPNFVLGQSSSKDTDVFSLIGRSNIQRIFQARSSISCGLNCVARSLDLLSMQPARRYGNILAFSSIAMSTITHIHLPPSSAEPSLVFIHDPSFQ